MTDSKGNIILPGSKLESIEYPETEGPSIKIKKIERKSYGEIATFIFISDPEKKEHKLSMNSINRNKWTLSDHSK